MQQQKSWLVYWFVLLMFTLSSCGGGGSGGGSGTNSPANDPTNPQKDKITIRADNSSGGIADGETNVSLIPILTLAFSTPMDPETINANTVIISSSPVNPNNTKDGQAVAIAGATPNADNTVFTFSPAAPLQKNTKYYVYVTQNAKAVNGAELDTSTQLSFSTGTAIVPTVSIINPANNAEIVTKLPYITIKFNESVTNISSDTVSLHEGSESGAIVPIKHITVGKDNTYSLTLVDELKSLTTYYVVISDRITDELGTHLKATKFNFTVRDTQQYAYVMSFSSGALTKCNVNTDGSFSACVSTGSDLGIISGVTINGGFAYFDTSIFNSITKCNIDDGKLVNCIYTENDFGNDFLYPEGIAFYGAYAYVTSNKADLDKCDVDQINGNLSNCTMAETGIDASSTHIKTNGNHVYITLYENNAVEICSINSSNGNLTDCHSINDTFKSPYDIAINGSYAYITTDKDGIYKCSIDKSNANLTNCETMSINGISSSSVVGEIAFNRGYAYLSEAHENKVLKCNAESDGNLTNCVATGGKIYSASEIAFTPI